MEAKDYKSNLRLCLERFRRQIEQFKKVTWQGRKFVVFFFGDYDLLCAMYGLSGAAGKHPCLWCRISSDQQFPKYIRSKEYEERSLKKLEQDLEIFHNNYASNIRKEMLANNVIDEYFFAVPLLQVCIPGLHLTLGIYIHEDVYVVGKLHQRTGHDDCCVSCWKG